MFGKQSELLHSVSHQPTEEDLVTNWSNLWNLWWSWCWETVTSIYYISQRFLMNLAEQTICPNMFWYFLFFTWKTNPQADTSAGDLIKIAESSWRQTPVTGWWWVGWSMITWFMYPVISGSVRVFWWCHNVAKGCGTLDSSLCWPQHLTKISSDWDTWDKQWHIGVKTMRV